MMEVGYCCVGTKTRDAHANGTPTLPVAAPPRRHCGLFFVLFSTSRRKPTGCYLSDSSSHPSAHTQTSTAAKHKTLCSGHRSGNSKSDDGDHGNCCTGATEQGPAEREHRRMMSAPTIRSAPDRRRSQRLKWRQYFFTSALSPLTNERAGIRMKGNGSRPYFPKT